MRLTSNGPGGLVSVDLHQRESEDVRHVVFVPVHAEKVVVPDLMKTPWR